MQKAKQKATAVTGQAAAVCSGAKNIEQAAERQIEALAQARALVTGASTATEEALSALRCVAPVCVCVCVVVHMKPLFLPVDVQHTLSIVSVPILGS